MKQTLLSLTALFVFLFMFSGFAQDAMDKNPNPAEDIRPSYTIIDALFDVQFNYNAELVTGANGNAAALFIPTLNEFWTSRWASNILHRWTAAGTLIEQFTIANVTGVRSLTFDGVHVYAGLATTTIAKIDPVTKTRVGTITSPQAARYLTYDPTADGGAGGLWLGDFSSALRLISMTGTALTTHPYASLGVTSIYGAAWDGFSAGGPYIWLWGQGSGQGFPQWLVQVNAATGLPTGVQHNVLTDIGVGNANAIAGGLFITDALVPGFATLGGMLQGVPDRLFGYELASLGPPCPIGPATNPTPADNAQNVSINPGNATWTNGAGATSIEVHFGTPGNLSMIYSGAPVTSVAIPGPLNYFTNYAWRVIGKNDTCQVNGPLWSFKTEQNPLLVARIDTCYPANVNYWTGSTDPTTKTEVSMVKGLSTEDGWFKFDISNIINQGTIIDSIRFHGYVSSANWPYWSGTPLPGLDPVTATPAELKAALTANNTTALAYIYSNEAQGFAPGWKSYTMGNSAKQDFLNAISQGWFAMGMDSRDNSTTYFVIWDGWQQPNKPFLQVYYHYVVPVELVSFTAAQNNNSVTLNWTTVTETNNSGFQVERSSGDDFVSLGFVQGSGSTVEKQNYTFVDENITPGTYSYRLKQVDFDGTFEYSSVIEIEVSGPREFTLNQNYPNPFNPSTIINFTLPVDAKVSLKIFDVLGQEVMTLVNNNLGAGIHEYNFDASSFNSGVYFYRIEASGTNGQNFTSVKKMVLTK
jgi:hypothetical protein